MLISVKENWPPLGKRVLLMRENLDYPIPVYLKQETIELSHVSPGSDKVKRTLSVNYNWVSFKEDSVEPMLEGDYWMPIPKVPEQTSFVERMIEERDALSKKIEKAEKGAQEIKMSEMARMLLYSQISAMRTYRDILHSRLCMLGCDEKSNVSSE